MPRVRHPEPRWQAPSMMPTEFHPVDWNAPFDASAHLAAVPTGATIRTLFLRDLITQAQRRNKRIQVDEGSLDKRDYPLREYMGKLLEASALLYPNLKPRSALRQLGRTVFPTFVESLVGRAMLGVMGHDVTSIMKLLNSAAAATISLGHVATLRAVPGEAVLHLRQVYFSDTYQIGVFEGMLDATRKRGANIRLHAAAVHDVYLQITWQDADQRAPSKSPSRSM